MSQFQEPSGAGNKGVNRVLPFLLDQELSSDAASAPKLIITKQRNSRSLRINQDLEQTLSKLFDFNADRVQLASEVLERIGGLSTQLQDNYRRNKELVLFRIAMGSTKEDIAKLGPEMKKPSSKAGFVKLASFIGPMLQLGKFDLEEAAVILKELLRSGLIETKGVPDTEIPLFKLSFKVERIREYGAK